MAVMTRRISSTFTSAVGAEARSSGEHRAGDRAGPPITAADTMRRPSATRRFDGRSNCSAP